MTWRVFLCAVLVAGCAGDQARVVVAEAGERRIAARALQDGGVFGLAYEHSVYRAPAVEIFTADGARFVMRAVASPNEAVLDYYAIAGGRERDGGWWVLRLARPQPYDSLSLMATEVGRRMLVVGGDCVPLYARGGAVEVRIRLARGEPAGPAAACPDGVVGAVREGAVATKD